MPPNEPSGLLSKVVKFVRNPTTNWSDLDQPELDKESQYSKQMLKEMIERKRRNDFVRRREFDELRKLRQREVRPATDAVERPSFFQSSIPSKLDDRAGTLKKIDEIEAQMSKQWWKAKDASTSQPVHLSARASLLPADATGPVDGSRAYAATVPAALPLPQQTPQVDPYAPTDAAPMRARRATDTAVSDPVVDMLAALDDSLNAHLTAPSSFELPPDGGDFAHDPALEEAAIRFANGDTTGAEAALQLLLHAEPLPSSQSEVWLALFDLYRATNQQDRFDTVGIQYATQFGRSGPAWFSIPDQAGHAAPAYMATDPMGLPDNILHWICPHVLGAAAVAGLQSALRLRKPSVLQLNWTRLGLVESAALDALAGVFSDWTQQDAQLNFVDADQLEELVKSYTRTGDATVNPLWWRLRLDLLRIQQCHDAFDMVALEYCITYEVSPPSWQDPRCQYKAVDAEGGSTVPDPLDLAGTNTLDFRDSRIGGAESTRPRPLSTLSGLVLGDATAALAAVDAPTESGGVLVVGCEHLMRIDFSAAGSVLNWAAAQQADGRSIQFTGLHRLAAIFFNVIGIHEYAKVIPRRN